MNYEIPTLSCNRCGHKWYSRTPNVCPKCKSPYWNKKRVRKINLETKGCEKL